jgi:hypothetical protein
MAGEIAFVLAPGGGAWYARATCSPEVSPCLDSLLSHTSRAHIRAQPRPTRRQSMPTPCSRAQVPFPSRNTVWRISPRLSRHHNLRRRRRPPKRLPPPLRRPARPAPQLLQQLHRPREQQLLQPLRLLQQHCLLLRRKDLPRAPRSRQLLQLPLRRQRQALQRQALPQARRRRHQAQ